MERGIFLTRVVLENYKSIAHCDVRLGPLTYLVGPNGSGKSNFLDALRFVSDALEGSVAYALRSRGGGGAICHAAQRQEGFFSIQISFLLPSGSSGTYRLKVGTNDDPENSGTWEVQEEQLDCPPHSFSSNTGRGLNLARFEDDPGRRAIYTSLSTMLFYSVMPHRIDDIESYDHENSLRPDASNLASMLFRLGPPHEDVLERINEYLRLILPGLLRVRVVAVTPGNEEIETNVSKLALLFEQQGSGVHLFYPSQMSEGTLRSLYILTALLQANVEEGPRPSLIAIEEPETHAHPAILTVLRDAMQETSYCSQVLVTTHSADILDDEEVDSNSILAVLSENGATRIAGIDDKLKEVIRERLYTPGELMRMGQLLPQSTELSSVNGEGS